MPAAPIRKEPLPQVEPEISRLSKVQKVAALLVLLGPEAAAQLLKHFEEHELEAVSAEMAKITLVSQELQRDLLREFSDLAVEAGTGRLGGVEYTQQVLEKSVGLFKASNLVNRVAPTRMPVAAMQQIIEADARYIYNLLKNEQPQTIALILSYLASEKASQVLFLLPAEVREQVIERLATLAPTPLEVIERVVEVLNARTQGKQPRALNQTGGVKSAAAILNALDKNLSKMVLMSIEERNPELAQHIQQKMFTFEDLATIETPAVQRILREVDLAELAVALKSASEQLKAVLLGSISKRAAETVNEEISLMGPVKLRDIEGAQAKIIEIVRRLEAEGEIDLSNPRETQNASAA
jgi:flagellar motor switch protein FliG